MIVKTTLDRGLLIYGYDAIVVLVDQCQYCRVWMERVVWRALFSRIQHCTVHWKPADFSEEPGGDMHLTNVDDFQWATRCYTPEHRTLRNNRCENLKSYKQWYAYSKRTKWIQESNLENMALSSLSLIPQGRVTMKYKGCESTRKRRREVSRNKGETVAL
jgi:hypothetical protein